MFTVPNLSAKRRISCIYFSVSSAQIVNPSGLIGTSVGLAGPTVPDVDLTIVALYCHLGTCKYVVYIIYGN